jgi:hypothetical protein
MKLFIHLRLKNLHWLWWSCLWAIPIAFVLFTQPGFAAPPGNIDFGAAGDCPEANNTTSDISQTVGDTFDYAIGVDNPPASFNWSFDLVPTPIGSPPCTGGGDTYTCSNTTISLPATGGPGSTAGVASPNANPAGLYLFDLAAQAVSSQCIRPYRLDITEADSPFDLGFVLDRSGSMTLNADPSTPGTSRWAVLKDSVVHFAGNLVTFNQAHTNPSGNAVGLTLFATNVIGNTVLPNNLTSINNTLPTQVEQELNQTPSGLTAMGAGLKSALGAWSPTLPVPLDPSRSRVVVLMTDGDQNQNPRINLDGRGFNDGTAINPSYPAAAGSVKVVTMGIGTPSGNTLTTLQNIAAQNRGTYISTADGQAFSDPDNISWSGTIDNAFEYAIAPALNSNSPLMVASYEGRLTDASVTLPEFELNFNLKRLLIDVSFDRSFKRPELEQLLKGIRIYKDGLDITDYFQPQIATDMTHWASLVTDFSRPLTDRTRSRLPSAPIPSEGRYLIKLLNPGNVKDLGFQVFPFADDAHLDATWSISPIPPQVNQSITITTNLRWRGQPLKNAMVEAYVAEPLNYNGDLLAQNPLVVDLARDQRDAVSPGEQKYLYLLENDPEFAKQLAFQPQRIPLKDQGNGTYIGRYTPRVPGTSQVFIQVQSKDPELGTPVQRLLFQSLSTQVGDINLATSAINTQFISNGAIINWRPMTINQRFVGPGNGSGITIQGAERTVITDNQNGSYTMSLPGVTPETRIAIRFLDKTIYQGPAREFTSKPQSACVGWLCSIQDWLSKLPIRILNQPTLKN